MLVKISPLMLRSPTQSYPSTHTHPTLDLNPIAGSAFESAMSHHIKNGAELIRLI